MSMMIAVMMTMIVILLYYVNAVQRGKNDVNLNLNSFASVNTPTALLLFNTDVTFSFAVLTFNNKQYNHSNVVL